MSTQLTNAEFLAKLQACDFQNPKQVSDLITQTYTEMKIQDKVHERHLMGDCTSYKYFTGFFGTETWGDGQGQQLMRDEYFEPRLNMSFNRFVKTMEVCDPNAADECNTCYETLPEGGRGTLPPIEMYKWGIKTQPQCIANMRHIKDFQAWSNRIINARYKMESQIMEMFYTFCALRAIGHKVVLEGVRENGKVTDRLVPRTSDNARNPFGAFAYSYRDVMFPRILDADNILPLDLSILEILTQRWSHFDEGNWVAKGPRNEKIFEFWHPDDWYRDQVIENPDYFDKVKMHMPNKAFAGYSLDPGQREVIGNFAMRSMPCLPRFAESTQGGLIPLDVHETIPAEVGEEFLPGRNWLNAPFGVAMQMSPNLLKILTRPALTKSPEGFDIHPITGNGGWWIRNPYDKDCNPDENMPWAQKRVEMGYIPNDPNSSIGIIFRFKKFRLRASNECDFRENFTLDPQDHDCTINIGCAGNQRHAPAQIDRLDENTRVLCSSETCGDNTIISIDLELAGHGQLGTNPLARFGSCACGDTVKAVVYDEDGVFSSIVDATIIDMDMLYPWGKALIKLDAPLGDGECIKELYCPDTVTPTVATVVDCWDSTHIEGLEGVKYQLDAPLSCGVGDNVTITYLDENGDSLGTVDGAIAEQEPGAFIIRVTSAEDPFGCAQFDGQVTVTITCA